MIRARHWAVILVLLGLVGTTACAFLELDTHLFPCDTDRVCTGSLLCIKACPTCQGHCLPKGSEPTTDGGTDGGTGDKQPDPTPPEERTRTDKTAEPPPEIPSERQPEKPPEGPPETPITPTILQTSCKPGSTTCLIASAICKGECVLTSATAPDTKGAVYVGGMFSGDFFPDSSGNYSSKGYSDAFVLKWDQTGSVAWLRSFGSEKTTRNLNQVKQIITGPSGHIYVLAEYVDHYFLEDKRYEGNGGVGVLLLKYTTEGKLVWHKRIDGKYTEQGHSLVLGPEGNIYIAGNFSESIQIDNKTLKTPTIQSDVFLASWKTDGTLRWAISLSSRYTDYAIGIAVVQQHIWVTATGFNGLPANIGGKQVGASSANAARLALLKFNVDGTLLDAHFSDGSGSADGLYRSIFAASPDGSLYFASAAVGPKNILGTTCGSDDLLERRIFIARLSTKGKVDWCQHSSYGRFQEITALLPQGNGQVLLAGSYRSGIHLGNDLKLSGAGGNNDLFLAAIDSAGRWRWAIKGSSVGNDAIRTIQPGGDQNLLLFGGTSDTFDFGDRKQQFNGEAMFMWDFPLP